LIILILESFQLIFKKQSINIQAFVLLIKKWYFFIEKSIFGSLKILLFKS